MFFDSPLEIEQIGRKTGTSIFVLPETVKVEIKNALILKPDEKKTITIDQVRELSSLLSTKQLEKRYIVIRPAESLGEEAANALLKNLEEPKENVHFLLITENPSRLLPTILSRSALYVLKIPVNFDANIDADAKIRDLAKRLIVAKGRDLVILTEELTKKKEGTRERVLNVLAIAIEILYKSYFKTYKSVFLEKIPNFLRAYENIEKSGHLKLQLVANLI